jgi:hypothetical protein
MPNLPSPPDTGPLPPPDTIPYFLRCAAVDKAVELEKARRCLTPAA